MSWGEKKRDPGFGKDAELSKNQRISMGTNSPSQFGPCCPQKEIQLKLP
jgi:hypothetical protein